MGCHVSLGFSKNIIVLVISVLLSHVPEIAMAAHTTQVGTQMISTETVLSDLDQSESEQKIGEFLLTSNAQNELMMQGISSEEASARLASLSDLEIRDLSMQIQEAKAGGDVLITVLLILLIVFLVQRI